MTDTAIASAGLKVPLGGVGRNSAVTLLWDAGAASPPVLAVTGREGSGKSTWLARIVEGLAGTGVLLVVDDPTRFPAGQDGLEVWRGESLDDLLAAAGLYEVVVFDKKGEGETLEALVEASRRSRFPLLAVCHGEEPVRQVFPPIDAHTVLTVDGREPGRGTRIRDLDGSPMVPVCRPGE